MKFTVNVYIIFLAYFNIFRCLARAGDNLDETLFGAEKVWLMMITPTHPWNIFNDDYTCDPWNIFNDDYVCDTWNIFDGDYTWKTQVHDEYAFDQNWR